MAIQVPDFSDWTVDRLIGQRKHLESTLFVSAGQNDPLRPQLRAEIEAIRAELTRRATCPACLDGRHGECEDPCKCPCPAPMAGEKES
jgi:hypothetical protein